MARVDHTARRRELTTAVWSLIARGGVEAVALRTVAAEAGVSMGRIQYYFATKDELLLHALQEAHQQMEARVRSRIEATWPDDKPSDAERDHAVLAAILEELLGEHPETRDAIRVHAAFAASAPDAARSAVLTDGDDAILALARNVIETARDAGLVVDVDPEVDSYALFTLAGALGSDVALRDAPLTRAKDALDRQLRRVTGRPLAPQPPSPPRAAPADNGAKSDRPSGATAG